MGSGKGWCVFETVAAYKSFGSASEDLEGRSGQEEGKISSGGTGCIQRHDRGKNEKAPHLTRHPVRVVLSCSASRNLVLIVSSSMVS